MTKFCVVSLVVLASFLPASAETAVTLTKDTECGGLLGTLDNGSLVVHFNSCPTAGALHSRFWTAGGQPISEVDYNTDSKATRYWVAGIELTGSETELERATIESTLHSAPALLAATTGRLLLKLGMDPTTPEFRGVAADMVGLTYPIDDPNPIVPDVDCMECNNPTTGCRGCCGAGCSGNLGGCMGVCTTSCEAHDDCVGVQGSAACYNLLVQAIRSVLACLGRAALCCDI